MTPAIVATALALLLGASTPPSAYEALTAAQKCKSSTEFPDAMDCDFDLGATHFTVLWIRSDFPQVNIVNVDRESPFKVVFLPRNGCVQVARAKHTPATPSDLDDMVAFVSTATGGVYRTFDKCTAAKAAAR